MGVKNLFNRAAFSAVIEESKYSVQEIADMVPCQANELYRYKRGDSTPRLARLKRLVEILGPSITGLAVSTHDDQGVRFTEVERHHLNWFRGLPVYQQARMLGAFAAVYEFGGDVDAEFAADLAEQMIVAEQQQKEQPG